MIKSIMNHNYEDEDGKFYKGLFYGALLGIGLVWFLGTKEGKKIKKQITEKGEEFVEKAQENIDAALSEGFVENEGLGVGETTQDSEDPPKRYFEDK